MTDNTIKGGVDPQTWVEVFEAMEPKVRRWAFISAKMAERRQTFRAMAKRHGMSTWYLASAAHGKTPLTPRAVKALESDLCIDLRPFLSPDEASKMRRDVLKEETL